MTDGTKIRGGCLCGALRYETTAPPITAGFCCCKDCRKISGAGCNGFLGFRAADIRFTGATTQLRASSSGGAGPVRNSCSCCGSLVFGGVVGVSPTHPVYAGSLDDASLFKPNVALFVRDKPDWVILPPGLKIFETMPGAQ